MNFLLNTNQNTISNKKNTIMQKTQTTNEPTPQNISKWSLGRKEIINKNKSLRIQLDSKNRVINELEKQIDELNLRVKLYGLNIPQSLSNSVDVTFDFEFKSSDDTSLTYYVSNSELDYHNEVEVEYSDLFEYFGDDEITESNLKDYIRETISDSLYF
jgi:hypothetical protein